MQIEIPKEVYNEKHQILHGRNDYDVIICWGGRGSAKSFSVQTYCMIKMLEANNKIVLCRKVKENVKGSMFAGLVDKFRGFGLYNYYTMTKNPLELEVPMVGSLALGRGFDDPDKIKSTHDPTIGWIEEADQCTENDFDVLFTTLRHSKLKTQMILTFNPEVGADGKNWIIERFLNGAENAEKLYGKVKELEQEITYEINGKTEIQKLKILSIHSTYRDNPFCPPKDRATYESYKEIDINKWNVWANGKIGQKEVKKPFFVNFKEEMIKKHVFDPELDTVISFDFNTVPSTCTISQENKRKTFKRYWREIRLGTKENKSDVYDVCEVIIGILPKYRKGKLIIRGDATGKNSNAMTKGDINAYDIIRQELNLSIDNFEIPKININHKNSFSICNEALRIKDITFDPSMQYSIIDLKYLEIDNGKILKKEAEKIGRGHLADCIRYDLHIFKK